MAPLTFDLNKIIDRVVFDCEDLPDPEKLRVDILELANCPPFKIEGDGLLGLKLGSETIVKYGDEGRVATKIKFINFKDQPTLEFETRYKLPSVLEDSMDIRRGNRRLANLRKSAALRKDPAMQRDVEALERIANIAVQLHEQVKTRYRFYFVVGGHEVLLGEAP